MAALRALNAPIGVWFSCLSQTSAPNAADNCGQTYCGVGGTSERRNSAADSIAARSGSTGDGSVDGSFMAAFIPRNIEDEASTVTVQLLASIPPLARSYICRCRP